MGNINVGLLFGGRSGEHEVSIKSAKSVAEALEKYPETYNAYPFYIDVNGIWQDEEISQDVLRTEQPKTNVEKLHLSNLWNYPESASNIDVWFPVLHGPYGEDGTVQGFLKLMRRPYVGAGVLGSAAGMDKLFMKSIFAQAGLPQLPYLGFDTFTVRAGDGWSLGLLKDIEEKLGYPCFIKPANSGSSLGISRAKNRNELIKALDLAASFDHRLIVEKASASRFRELECGILGNSAPQASPAGEMIYSEEYEFFDYTAKYTEGKQHFVIPAKIPETISKQIQEMAIRAFKVIACSGLARVDFFYSDLDNQLYINEINTIPGLTAFSMYPSLWKQAGIEFPELIHKLLDLAVEKHNLEKSKSTLRGCLRIGIG